MGDDCPMTSFQRDHYGISKNMETLGLSRKDSKRMSFINIMVICKLCGKTKKFKTEKSQFCEDLDSFAICRTCMNLYKMQDKFDLIQSKSPDDLVVGQMHGGWNLTNFWASKFHPLVEQILKLSFEDFKNRIDINDKP
jgi:hypothetical protein